MNICCTTCTTYELFLYYMYYICMYYMYYIQIFDVLHVYYILALSRCQPCILLTWILELRDCSASGFFSCRVPSTDCGVYSRNWFNRTYTENSSLDRRIIQFSYQLFLSFYIHGIYALCTCFLRLLGVKSFKII